jgi:hypothetical protein
VCSVSNKDIDPSNAEIGIYCIEIFSSKVTVSLAITNRLMLYEK